MMELCCWKVVVIVDNMVLLSCVLVVVVTGINFHTLLVVGLME